MKTVPLTQARYNLRDLVHRARAGETFVLSDRGREVAAITSLSVIDRRIERKSTREFMKEVDQLRARITAEVKKNGITKTSTQLLREDRLSH